MEWIPVRERLPPNSNLVLAVNDGRTVLACFYRSQRSPREAETYWHGAITGRPWDNITHWMPLPTPP